MGPGDVPKYPKEVSTKKMTLKKLNLKKLHQISENPPNNLGLNQTFSAGVEVAYKTGITSEFHSD